MHFLHYFTWRVNCWLSIFTMFRLRSWSLILLQVWRSDLFAFSFSPVRTIKTIWLLLFAFKKYFVSSVGQKWNTGCNSPELTVRLREPLESTAVNHSLFGRLTDDDSIMPTHKKWLKDVRRWTVERRPEKMKEVRPVMKMCRSLYLCKIIYINSISKY